jgi:hypothetical protein
VLIRCLALSVLLALSSFASGAPVARADDPRVRLTYVAEVSGCPTRDGFSDQVAARLGMRPFVDTAERAITIRIDQDGPLLRGRIVHEGGGATRELAATDCAQLVQMLAAVLAVELDPSAGADAPDVFVGGPVAPAAPVVVQPLVVAPPAPPEILVRIESARPADELMLHRASSGRFTRGRFGAVSMAFDSRSWERLCDAPCELRLESGAHHFAISRGLGSAVAQAGLTRIDRPSVIRLDLVDRGPERLAGGLVLGIGLPVGLGLIASTIWVDYQWDGRVNAVVLVGSGGVVVVASLIVGLFFAHRRDVETLDVLPLALTDQGLAVRF